jgi:hypothetical protein
MDGLERGAKVDRVLPAPGPEAFLQELDGSQTAAAQAMEEEDG